MSDAVLSPPFRPVRLTRPGLNAGVAAASLVVLAGLLCAVWLQPGGTWRLPALGLVGAAIGAVLLRTSFGFAGAFRALVESGDRSGFRAHAVMIALASLLMFPMLAQGTLWGVPMRGEATPVGVGFAVGALLFGAGMQVGGGCASGTLFALGGGNGKLLGTVAGFVLGSALGAWSMGFWWSLPTLPGVSLPDVVGFLPALAVQLAVLAGLFVWAGRGGRSLPTPRILIAGGIMLALLNAATMVLAGKPWGETSAFALWGSKLFTAAGVDAHGWAYWLRPGFNTQLDRTTSLDVTSVMDAAILCGAALAAALAGAFRPRWGGGGRAWAGALLGGVAMGFGARLSNGCNIGAYFSALSVGNMSGWAWMLLAMAGSWFGIRLRPLFGLGGPALVCAPGSNHAGVPPDCASC